MVMRLKEKKMMINQSAIFSSLHCFKNVIEKQGKYISFPLFLFMQIVDADLLIPYYFVYYN